MSHALPILAALLFLVTSPCAAGSNLVVNGDFDAGNTGFTSDAVFVASGLLSRGEYSIRTDPSTANSQWCGNDHTSGGAGNLFVVDGFSGMSTIAWRQTITVTPGVSYDFSAWTRNLVCTNDFSDPVIELRADSGKIAGPTAIPEDIDPDQWQRISGAFTAGSTMVTLEIVTTAAAAVGNDFALDDISVTPAMQCLIFRDLEHCALGAAKLTLVDDELVVSNIGSSGEDGVVVSLGSAQAWRAEMPTSVVSQPPTPGASVETIVKGSILGIPDQPIYVHLEEAIGEQWRFTSVFYDPSLAVGGQASCNGEILAIDSSTDPGVDPEFSYFMNPTGAQSASLVKGAGASNGWWNLVLDGEFAYWECGGL